MPRRCPTSGLVFVKKRFLRKSGAKNVEENLAFYMAPQMNLIWNDLHN